MGLTGWRDTVVPELWHGPETEVVLVFINVPLVCECEGSRGQTLLWIRFYVVPSAYTDKSAKKQNKHLDAPKDLPLFNTHSTHALPTGQFDGYVCGVASLAHIVPGHKTRPVCEGEEWERMVVSEEKGPVMSLPPQIPQTYFGYNYLFDS